VLVFVTLLRALHAAGPPESTIYIHLKITSNSSSVINNIATTSHISIIRITDCIRIRSLKDNAFTVRSAMGGEGLEGARGA
jgi:hypothetical protein